MSNINFIKNPLDMLYQWEQQTPNDIFLKQPIGGIWKTYTWREAAHEVRCMAAALKSFNLPEKSNIAIISKNCAHWILADLAIMMSGHVSVPLYPNISATTLNYVLTHSETKLLMVGKLDDWDSIKSGVPDTVQCIAFPYYAPPNTENYLQWNALCSNYNNLTNNVLRQNEDIATIIYTSGTTGNPKGVIHTFSAMAYGVTMALDFLKVNYKGRFFSYLPLSHIAERMLVEMGGIYTGGTIAFAESLDTFAKNLQTIQPNIFLGVPRIWTKFQQGILAKMPQEKLNKLLKIPLLSTFIKNKIKKGLGLNQAKICITGAAPIPASLLQWFKTLDIEILEAYGMTENCAYSHLTPPRKVKYGFVGVANPEVEVKISPEGEILVKNKCTMTEYYKEPELTAEALQDGYLYTGDQGFVDQDGYLKITGRVKDIFKTDKGKYVAPSPIELKLLKNENIEQVCVTGSNLPQPIALVVLSPTAKQKNKDEVLQSLKDTLKETNNTLDKHEILRNIIVVKDEWSTENGLITPTLKIKRQPIENLYKDNFEKWYANAQNIIWE